MPRRLKLQAAIDRALKSGAPVKAHNEYLVLLRSALAENVARYQRALFLLVLLIVGFELLGRVAVTQVTVGPFTVSDISFVQKVLPVAAAYAYYDLLSIAGIAQVQRMAHDKIMARVHKSHHAASLHIILRPFATFAGDNLVIRLREGRLTPLVEGLSLVTGGVLLLGPLILVLYAIYASFVEFGTRDLVVWIVAILSVVLSAQGLVVLNQAASIARTESA